jgi:hypothetical protein
VQEGHDVFEVSLMIRAEAQEAQAPGGGNGAGPAPNTVFVAEMTYSGVFTTFYCLVAPPLMTQTIRSHRLLSSVNR